MISGLKFLIIIIIIIIIIVVVVVVIIIIIRPAYFLHAQHIMQLLHNVEVE